MSQARFFALIEQFPRLSHLWNPETGELMVEAFEAELGVLSAGEVHMARFLASVWFHDNQRYGFDLVAAAAQLDEPERAVILDWLADPFWP